MRESLFRAAQQGGYYPSEEIVGQYQDEALSRRCHDESLAPIDLPARERRDTPALVIWPYPTGTADAIDRASCADAFVREFPAYRVVTALGLGREDLRDLASVPGDILVFAPFEAVVPETSVDGDGVLRFRGRRVDAVTSELFPGYLRRRGTLPLEFDGAAPVAGPLATDIVNASSVAASKGLQMPLFERFGAGASGLAAMPYAVVNTEDELAGALARLLPGRRGATVRPFSASQGTGIAFVDASAATGDLLAEARRAVASIRTALRDKYGGDDAFPLTVTPFEESVLVDGCVTDIRVFVVHDPAARGLRAVPAMVRRAQVPLDACERLGSDCGMTNLNAPKAAGAAPGERILPVAHPRTLALLGLDEDRLVALCRDAAALWAAAFAEERGLFTGNDCRQFAYGSVDVIVRGGDGALVPVELNGANVGSHPTVHPALAEVFGVATTAALRNLGLGR